MLLQDPGVRRLVTAIFIVAARPDRAEAAAQTPAYRAAWGDVVAVAGAGVVSIVPAALGLPRGAPPCAPCDAAQLPGFDRWAVGLDSRAAGVASDVLAVGVAGYGFLASLQGVSAQRARGDAAVFLDAVGWTTAATEWLKAVIHRSRPVLYTAAAPGAATSPDSRESLPSGHSSVAFAAATAYAVMAQRQHLPHAVRNTVLLYGGAAGVAALRVDAGKHFPSDVLAGAVLGGAIGGLVAAVHPKAQR